MSHREARLIENSGNRVIKLVVVPLWSDRIWETRTSNKYTNLFGTRGQYNIKTNLKETV